MFGPHSQKKKKLFCKYCNIDFDIDLDKKKNLEAVNVFIHLSLAEQLTHLFQNHQDLIINPAKRLNSYAIKIFMTVNYTIKILMNG